MNLLVVAPHFPPSRVGGVESYSKALADALDALGHRVEVAAVETLASGPVDDCASVDAHAAPPARYPVHRLTLTLQQGRRFPLLWEHAPAERWFDTTMRRLRPDLVHVHSGYIAGAPALAAAERCGIPSVVTLHDYWFACPRITLRQSSGALCEGPDGVGKCAWCLAAEGRAARWPDAALMGGLGPAFRWAAERGMPPARRLADTIAHRQRGVLALLQRAAAVVAPTRFVARQVAQAGFPADRIRLSPYGLPPVSLAPRTPGGGLRIAYIGQVAPHKGVHLLVEAVRAIPDAGLSVAVHGPLDPDPTYVAELRRLAGGDTRIRFAGAYDRATLPGVLAATDLVVVPSTWYEVAGIVIMEAHAAGIPVVASRIGGIPELVTDAVDGLLFDPFTPGDLQAKMERLLREPGLLARLAGGIRPPRTMDDDVRGLLDIYGEAIGRA